MNNYLARMNFENAQAAIDNAFRGQFNKDGSPITWRQFKLTQSYLRTELPLVTTSSQYEFQILVNQPGANGLIFNTERRLQLQDSFIPSELGFYLGYPTSNTDATYKLCTYPNAILSGSNATALAMQAVYNGELSITVNGNVLTPQWDLWRHYDAGITQQTAALGAGSPNDEFRGSCAGMYPMEPNVVMIGSKNTQLTVQLRTSLTAVTAFSRIILFQRGILAQNSTPIS